MQIKSDNRFAQAVTALVEVWCAQDIGERADEAAKLYRDNARALAEETGKPLNEVQHMISTHAMTRYMELV